MLASLTEMSTVSLPSRILKLASESYSLLLFQVKVTGMPLHTFTVKVS